MNTGSSKIEKIVRNGTTKRTHAITHKSKTSTENLILFDVAILDSVCFYKKNMKDKSGKRKTALERVRELVQNKN